MLVQELINKNLKKGVYHKATWKSTKNINGVEYSKVSSGVVRIVKYGNIKVVKAKLSEKAPTTTTTTNKQWLIEDLLYYNTNTGNHLVTLGTTKHKTQSVYYANGQEITKEEYESVVKSNHNDTLIFNVKIENLISID